MNIYVQKLARSRRGFRWLAQLLALCSVFIAPLAACSNMKTVSWREEVRLHTGQVITVDRSETFRMVYSGGPGPGWLFQSERITAHFPPPIGDVTWSGILTPIAIDATSADQLYLVANIANLAGAKEYPRPGDIPQVAFKYLGHANWQRIPISEVPGQIHRNLLVDTYDLFIQNHSKVNYVGFDLKEKIDSDPRISKDLLDWPRQKD